MDQQKKLNDMVPDFILGVFLPSFENIFQKIESRPQISSDHSPTFLKRRPGSYLILILISHSRQKPL